jgi:hypothetical protein
MTDNRRNDNAVSNSEVDTTQAGAQTGAAQSGAGSASQQAGSQTGKGQASTGAAYESAGAETTTDIGQAEAYLVNMKRLVANELNHDANLNQVLVTSAQRLARNAEDWDAQVRNLSLRALQLGQLSLENAVALSNRVNNASVDLDTRIKQESATHDKNLNGISMSERERTVRGGDAGDVIRWAALSDNPIYQDLISAAAAKVAELSKEQV